MQVSAVGGIGAGAAGGVGGAAASSSAGPAGAAAGASLTGTFLQGTTPAGPEMLTNNAPSFSEINLLFTLLMLSLLEKSDRKDSGAAGVLGFLAGLSLAAQLGQALGSPAGQSIAPAGGAGGLGGQLDVTA